jgi:hypothetical protein
MYMCRYISEGIVIAVFVYLLGCSKETLDLGLPDQMMVYLSLSRYRCGATIEWRTWIDGLTHGRGPLWHRVGVKASPDEDIALKMGHKIGDSDGLCMMRMLRVHWARFVLPFWGDVPGI